MGSETRFFERKLDRTAYGACYWLAIFVIVGMLALAWLLWTAGTLLRHQTFWQNWHLPHIAVSTPNPQAAIDSAKQAAQQKIQDAADQAAKDAADKATQAAKDQAQKAASTAATGASQNLNQFLNQ